MRGIVKGGWFDFPDFYKQASGYAKSYCKNHPEADRETVYIAASEAATHYEWSEKLRHYKLKNIVYLYIRNALYKQKRKNKEDNMDKELKQAIIRDYQSGMTAGEIAERYGLHPHTTLNNITNWAAKGLLELRPTTPKPEDKPKHIKAKEKEPATAATVTSSESATTENLNDNIIAEIPAKVNSEAKVEGPTEEVKEATLPEANPVIDFIEFCTREVAVLGKRFKVLRCAATNETGVAEIRFKDENGFEYVLELRGIEEETI